MTVCVPVAMPTPYQTNTFRPNQPDLEAAACSRMGISRQVLMRVTRVISCLFLVFLLTAGAFAAQLRQIAMIDLPGDPGFDGLAFARGALVITHTTTQTVEIFDPLKRRIIAQVKDVPDPQGIAADDRAERVYIANGSGKSISIISSKDWKLIETISLNSAPYALALSGDGKLLFAANWRDRSISAIEVGAGYRARTAELNGTPHSIVYDPERRVVYASMQDTQEIAAIDENLRVVSRFKLLASQPTGLALDAAARRLYVAVRNAVVALQLDAGTEVGRVAAPPGADALWLDKPSGTLYVASGGGFVTSIQATGSAFQALDEVRTQVRGHTLAYDPARQFIYLPGGRDGKSKLLILKRIVPGQNAQTETTASIAP